MEDQCQVFSEGNGTCFDVPRTVSSTHASSHHQPCPSRQHEHASWPRHISRTLLPTRHVVLFLILTCFLSFSSASSIYIDEEMIERSSRDVEVTEALGSAFARLARSGTILVDQSPPPEPQHWEPEADLGQDLRRRNTAASAANNKTSSASTISPSSSGSSTLAPTTTSSGIAAATTDSNSPLPTPFDTGFNNNITTSCQNFMTSMLSNATFKSCLPFSLLLQNSNSFFQASKSLVRITQTLDYSCAANLTTCSSLMSSLATNLTSASNCASDLSSQNPQIQQAHLGLLAYRTLYTASCLRDPTTSSYCFAQAITNASNPTDSYIYFLPLNVSLVGGSQPTCDSCLKSTMTVFEAATSDRASAIAGDYVSAASQVNVNCGPGFVNASLAAAVVSSGGGRTVGLGLGGGLGMGWLTVLLLVMGWIGGL